MPLSNPTGIERFEPLVREHQAGLRAYIRALGAQDAWVDDLAQEAFLVAYRRLNQFEAGGDFGRWLRGIARNLVLNDLRKNARRWRLLHEAIVDLLAEHDEPEPLAERAITGLLQAMKECVSHLPLRSRELLERRYAEGTDAASLARSLRVSADAVRQTLVRSRAAVRRCIEGKLGEAWL